MQEAGLEEENFETGIALEPHLINITLLIITKIYDISQ